jgi:hypothetical protein
MNLRWILPISAFLVSLVLVFANTKAVEASHCPIPDGSQNGTDVFNDNPDGIDGSWSIDGVWHDSDLLEWASSGDLYRHQWVRWSQAAVDKIRADEAADPNRKILIEMQVHPYTWYQWGFSWSSNLPIGQVYIADWFSSSSQGFEEASFVVVDMNQIQPLTNYNVQAYWNQENVNTAGYFIGLTQYTDFWLNAYFTDYIGSFSKHCIFQ